MLILSRNLDIHIIIVEGRNITHKENSGGRVFSCCASGKKKKNVSRVRVILYVKFRRVYASPHNYVYIHTTHAYVDI